MTIMRAMTYIEIIKTMIQECFCGAERCPGYIGLKPVRVSAEDRELEGLAQKRLHQVIIMLIRNQYEGAVSEVTNEIFRKSIIYDHSLNALNVE